MSSYTVGRLDQVVAQIAVAALAERGIFGLELAGFVGRPGQAGKLGDGVIVGEAADIAQFGDQSRRSRRDPGPGRIRVCGMACSSAAIVWSRVLSWAASERMLAMVVQSTMRSGSASTLSGR